MREYMRLCRNCGRPVKSYDRNRWVHAKKVRGSSAFYCREFQADAWSADGSYLKTWNDPVATPVDKGVIMVTDERKSRSPFANSERRGV